MALARYRPNRRGIRDLLGATGVQLDLQARAERVAAVARADYAARPPHSGQVEVTVDAGREPESGRARAAVIANHPGALGIETDRRPLGKALDAAG